MKSASNVTGGGKNSFAHPQSLTHYRDKTYDNTWLGLTKILGKTPFLAPIFERKTQLKL